MEALLYLAKAGVIYSVLYLIYFMLFRNNTNFEANRIYLLVIIPIAFILPFINTSVDVATEYQVVLPTVVIGNLTETNTTLDWSSILLSSYVVISGALLLILCINVFKTLQTISKIKQGKSDDVQPFSFFSFIHAPTYIEKEDRMAIIHHEKVHSTQLHSIDIIIYEISKVLLWWNPFLWMGLKSVKSNHEFIADKLASEKADKYSSVLVAQLLGVNCSVLANNFNYEPLIKKRIMMMKMKKSNRISVLKYALVVPIIALAIVATAQKEPTPPIADEPKAPIVDEPKVPIVDEPNAPSALSIKEKAKYIEEKAQFGKEKAKYAEEKAKFEQEKVKFGDDKVYDKVDVMPEYRGGMEALMYYLGSNIKYPDAAKKSEIEGMVYVNFVIDAKGHVKDVSVAKSLDPLLDAEAMRVIKTMNKWKPGEKDGKKVSVKFTIPIKFKLQE